MYYFIVNPNSCRGNGARIWKKLERQLQKTGTDYQVAFTQKRTDAKIFATELTLGCKDACTIIAVGGDGTINEILNGLTFDGPITLGYVPAGSGNDLAKSLRISKSPKRCLKRIKNPRYQVWLDYGVLSYGEDAREHRRFMVSCGIGLDAAVCHELLDIRTKKKPPLIPPGSFSYTLLGIKHLLRTQAVKGYLILDEVKKVELNNVHFISTHIHPYEGGGFRFAPKADCSDGNLEICVVQSGSRIRLALAILDAMLGRMRNNHRGIRFYRCKEVQIHMEHPLPVHVDGESCLYQTDIHLRCIEKKLRMLV